MVAEDGTVMTTGTIMTAALGEGPGTEPMPTTQVALTDAEEALAAAMEAVIALEGDEAATEAQIATAEAAVLTAEEARDAAQTAHDDYVATTPEAIAAADVEAKQRAEGLAAAIGRAQADAAGAFTDPSAFAPTIGAKHDGTAAAITTLTATGGTSTGVFAKQEEGPPSIKGWAGARFTRGEATEHVTVYTNIGAPKPTLFSEVEAYDEDSASGGVLAIVPDHASLAASDSFPDAPATKGSSSTQTYAGGADRTFAGTFHGGEGNYTCGADAETCSVTTSDKGALTFVGEWTFTFAAKAMVNVVDSDYLHFGWWVDAPAMADGTYAFQTFAGGALTFPNGSMNQLVGTATYKGAAAGMYVTKDVTAGLVTGATAGGFTASATLHANFGDGTATGNIDGSIHDFMNAEGEAMAGWGVTLRNSILGTTSTFSGDTMGTTGPGTTGTGNWTGTFYGPLGVDPGNTPDVDEVQTTLPTDVAGRFDAHLPGAHIAGAYGASKQ